MQPKLIGVPLIVLIFWVQASVSGWAQTQKVTAFVHVNLVPMTAETMIPDQTVLVKGNQITAVGPSNAIDVPEDSIIIDGSSFYLLPGLADMHIHTDTRWLNGGWPVSPFDLFPRRDPLRPGGARNRFDLGQSDSGAASFNRQQTDHRQCRREGPVQDCR